MDFIRFGKINKNITDKLKNNLLKEHSNFLKEKNDYSKQDKDKKYYNGNRMPNSIPCGIDTRIFNKKMI